MEIAFIWIENGGYEDCEDFLLSLSKDERWEKGKVDLDQMTKFGSFDWSSFVRSTLITFLTTRLPIALIAIVILLPIDFLPSPFPSWRLPLLLIYILLVDCTVFQNTYCAKSISAVLLSLTVSAASTSSK